MHSNNLAGHMARKDDVLLMLMICYKNIALNV